MATPNLAHRATNGHAPSTAVVRRLPVTEVDHLLELRGLIKRAQEEERRLTQDILAVLQSQGLRAIQGTRALGILAERTTLTVDPALFLEAAGPRAVEALTVSVTAARRILAEDDLAAIAETTTSPVLRVEALAG